MECLKTLDNVCIIIPVYKVKKKIGVVVKKLLKLKPSLIILVDDYCPHKSLKKLNKKNSKIVNIFHKSNMGVGGAFISGVKYLNKLNNEQIKYIAKIDSDDQHDPNDLINMKCNLIRSDADFVKGNRFMLMNRPKNMSFIRKIGIIFLTFMFKLATGQWHLSDPVNGIFIGQKKVIINSLKLNIKKRYLFESSLLFSLSELRAKIIENPVKIIYSNETSSLKWYYEVIPFFWFYINGFRRRIIKEYVYPDLNPGIIPLISFIIFFILLIEKLLKLRENIQATIISETGDVGLFVAYFITSLFSFYIWLLFDSTKYKNEAPIHYFFK